MVERVTFHPHAEQRAKERGASPEEIVATVLEGETIEAKFGRTGFRRNFSLSGEWNGRHYATKQLEVFAVKEDNGWLVITVIVKYF